MTFLETSEFWLIISLLAILYVSFFVGGYLPLSSTRTLKSTVGFIFLALLILMFVLNGIAAGIAAILFCIAWSFVSVPIIKFIASRANPELFDTFTNFAEADRRQKSGNLVDDLRYMSARSKMEQAERNHVARNPKMLNVLREFGKSDADLDNIYQICLASGIGIDMAWKIVTNPKQLRVYLDLKKRGLSDIDAAFRACE